MGALPGHPSGRFEKEELPVVGGRLANQAWRAWSQKSRGALTLGLAWSPRASSPLLWWRGRNLPPTRSSGGRKRRGQVGATDPIRMQNRQGAGQAVGEAADHGAGVLQLHGGGVRGTFCYSS